MMDLTLIELLLEAHVPPSLTVLRALDGFAGPEGLSGREVAELAELSPTTTIKYLHRLEELGA